MDPRKNRNQPKASNRGKNRGSISTQPASSSQPNPSRGQPNQFVNPQYDYSSQFPNQQYDYSPFGFTQYANQGGSSMPFQSGYNEFHLNPSPPPYRDRQFTLDSDDEEEEVPDTQENEEEEEEEVEVIPAPKTGKTKSKWWTQAEETALAKAFINTSNDPVKGDNQTHHSFWKKVLEVFNVHLGLDSGRNHHQVRSKWKDLNNKIAYFAALYNKRKSNMASGMNDEDVLKEAQLEYMRKYNTKHGFPHLGAWEVLRNFPKWSSVETFEEIEASSSKRAKTSESAARSRSFEADFMPLDLNEEQGDEDEPEPPARPTEPPRRNRKKPVESTSSDREQIMKMVCDFTTYNREDLEDKKRARAEKLRLKEKKIEARIALFQKQQQQLDEQQKERDLQFILAPHDQYTGAILETILARKKEMAARWGWEI